MHALIIEDDVSAVDLIERSLVQLGYRSFDVAFSAAEAIAAAARKCPDLISVEFRLMDGTGVDAVLRICAGIAIPVLFVTGCAGEVASRIPDAVIVEKPFEASALTAAVADAVRRPFGPASA